MHKHSHQKRISDAQMTSIALGAVAVQLLWLVFVYWFWGPMLFSMNLIFAATVWKIVAFHA